MPLFAFHGDDGFCSWSMVWYEYLFAICGPVTVVRRALGCLCASLRAQTVRFALFEPVAAITSAGG